MFVCRIIEVEPNYVEDGRVAKENPQRPVIASRAVAAKAEHANFSVLTAAVARKFLFEKKSKLRILFLDRQRSETLMVFSTVGAAACPSYST